MAGLSNAKALRVIGQDLAALDVNAFNLGRRGDDYTVWIEGRESDRSFSPKKLFGRIFAGREGFAKETPNPMHFSTSQIVWTDVARSLSRKGVQRVTDLNELSLLLRALGDFLDKNHADDFIAFWSRDSVKVVFDNREQNFTFLNLYDVGTHMYLKRSNRRPPV